MHEASDVTVIMTVMYNSLQIEPYEVAVAPDIVQKLDETLQMWHIEAKIPVHLHFSSIFTHALHLGQYY